MPTATERIFPASPTTGRASAALAAPWLFTGEDNLRVLIANSAAGVVITLAGRFLRAADSTPQAFSTTFTPTADRTVNTFNFAVGEGFLLNCSVIASSGSPLVGQTYCMLQVIRGFAGATIVLGALLGGYVTSKQHLAYPGSPIEASTAGEPYLRVVTGTTPAAGVDWSETVPTGARWELISIYAILTTAAGGSDRRPILLISSGAKRVGLIVPIAAEIAAQSFGISWVAAGFGISDPTSGWMMNQLPTRMILLAGSVFATSTTFLAAGDTWTALAYLVREWLEVN